VAVLARTHSGVPEVVRNGQRHVPRSFDAYGGYIRELLHIEDPGEVRFSTVHGFKGQEARAVILLDVTTRNYPLIHPTWALSQGFGDTIQAITEAERRLFYVAVSRPKTHLDIVTTNRNPSEFWTAVRPSAPVVPTSWAKLREVRLAGDEAQVEVRVFNSYDIKDQLNNEGYRYHGEGPKYWWKLVDASQFDKKALLATPWAKHPGVRVEAWWDDQRVLNHRVPVGQQ
jgi:hypothetical protein